MSTKATAAKTARARDATAKKQPVQNADRMAGTISKDASTAWERDQLDPDNWLRIPEFGVAPDAVRFKGFAFPIVEPLTFGDSIHETMRDMVRTARKLARAEFQTLAKLRVTFGVALNAFEYSGESLGTTRKLAAKEMVAMRYTNLMSAFELASSKWHESRREPVSERSVAARDQSTDMFAIGTSVVVNWLTGEPFERDLSAVSRLRDGARDGGFASARSRRDMSTAPCPARLRAEAQELIRRGTSPRDVVGKLAARHSLSQSYVRKLLKRS